MTAMSDSQREKFLARARIATLTYIGKDGAPMGVPVWFEWNGRVIHIVTPKTSPKVKYLRQDPRVCVIAGNNMEEPEGWVAMHGEVRIVDKSQDWHVEFGARLQPRYWALTKDPAVNARREAIRAAYREGQGAMDCYLLELAPSKIVARWEFSDPGDNF
jgi:PPOX class probable F420-dependent enzyme